MRNDHVRNLYVNDKNGVVFPKDEVDKAYAMSDIDGKERIRIPSSCKNVDGYIQRCFRIDNQYTLLLLMDLTGFHGNVVTKRLLYYHYDIVKYLFNPSFNTTKSLRILLTIGVDFSEFIFADNVQFFLRYSHFGKSSRQRHFEKYKEIITTLYFLGIQIHSHISSHISIIDMFRKPYMECVRDVTLFDMLYLRMEFTT